MLTGFHCYFGLGEYLINMRVEDYVVDAATVAHEAIPGLRIEESVVDYYGRVARGGSDVSPAIVIKFLD